MFRMIQFGNWASAVLLLVLGGLAVAGDQPAVALTAQELAWVQTHPVIKMCVDPDWAPFERINERGQHEGIAADLVQLVAQRVGLRIELLATRDWNESLRASQQRRCQILSFVNQTSARDAWLTFTEPIFLDPNVFITREEHAFIATPLSLSNETVALPRGTSVEEKIRRDFPNLHILITDSEPEAIELVESRRADMTMRSLIVAAYTIKKGGHFNLKIAGQIPEYANMLRIAVLKDEALLHSILDKGVQTLTPQEREQIANRHVSIQVQKGIDYALIWKIIGGALLLIAGAMYWNRRLAHFNVRLRQANEEISAAQAATHHALNQVAALLDNSAQGFLSFAADLRVKPQYSLPCKTMFGDVICGAAIPTLLYPEDATAAAQLERNLAGVFDATDEFKREVLISLLPGLFRRGERTLRAKYKMLAEGDMMLVLDDVSEELALQEQIQREQMRLKLVVSVFRERDDVRQVIRDFERFLAASGEATTRESQSRQIHTFKGVFAQFNFCHVPVALHSLEERLARNAAAPVVEAAGLRQALAKDIAILVEVLGYDPFSTEEQLRIDANTLRALESDLENLSPAEIRRRLIRLRHQPLTELLAGYPGFCGELAARLNKEIHVLHIEGERCAVDAERFGPFLRSLVHVFRNALDHGIESEDERFVAGKDEKGRLTCQVTRRGDFLQLIIGDDGRGIDVAQLRATAEARHIPLPDEVVMLIFRETFSTHAAVTEISGRGVGLAAVYAELQRLEGRVAVETQPGKGTRFIFSLPLNEYER